jgi:hypothetical protein
MKIGVIVPGYEHTRMTATGIPPNMVIAGEVVKLEVKVEQLQKALDDNYNTLHIKKKTLLKTTFQSVFFDEI